METIFNKIIAPFLIVFYFAAILLAAAAGFRPCWHCDKIKHVSSTRKYWTLNDTKKPVDVCEKCFDVISEYDREGFI